ncbi:GyrI-like domain-containing protein [Fictibacillus sp. b24]|uniref:GyrI-like domain-containing protein n=1 Tax=Fictibacillus sp. b24 TaxID=3055863 RepID=UPI0025A2E0FB|nr:GyrI-like domain-containing protein [Fictibacillus sp. b24]MDM5317271.1 GyrI-like domain-containing protein [Fictibacillus sp. b24]
MSEMQVKNVGEIKLIGYRVICAGEKYIEEIPNAAELLKQRTNEIKNVLNAGQQIGAFIVDAPSPKEDGYWICVQVSQYETIPENMVALTIPPQRYATISHKGPNVQIRNSYEHLHTWIAEQGYTRTDESWNLEIYQIDNNPENPLDVRVELYDSIL